MTEEQGKTPHSGNYVANDVERPTSVFFANQRVVKIVDGALAVSWTWEEREEERPDPSDPMYPYRMALKGINAEYTEAKLRAELSAALVRAEKVRQLEDSRGRYWTLAKGAILSIGSFDKDLQAHYQKQLDELDAKG